MKTIIQCLVCGTKRQTYKKGNFCGRECYYTGLRTHLVKIGRKGWHHSLESIEKIREAGKMRLGMKFTDAHRENIRKAKTGVTYKLKENVSYRGLHYWVESRLGRPDTCKHCGKIGLKGKFIQWANISKKYKRDLKDWVRLCGKCHKLFDKKVKI